MIPILNMSDAQALKERVMNRSQLQNDEISARVKEIVARVREEGDAALFDYTARFDKVSLTAETVLVTREEIVTRLKTVRAELMEIKSKLDELYLLPEE